MLKILREKILTIMKVSKKPQFQNVNDVITIVRLSSNFVCDMSGLVSIYSCKKIQKFEIGKITSSYDVILTYLRHRDVISAGILLIELGKTKKMALVLCLYLN